jgi:Cu(I)/Ag(I) efflux system membrane protein CusA/SilA
MKRIAAPMVGGVVTSFLLELLIYPAIYTVWKSRSEQRNAGEAPSA